MPAYIDRLTGGPTEPQLQILFQQLLDNKKVPCSLLYLNVKCFHSINAMYGHEMGDWVLKRIYFLLNEQLNEGELLSRTHTNTFVAIVFASNAEELQKRILQMDDAVYFDEELKKIQQIFFSIGGYIINDVNDTYDHAVDCANYSRVNSPDHSDMNTHFEIYGLTIQDKRGRSLQLMKKAQIAIKEKGHFLMYLQPKYELEGETLAGAEALIRWRDPEEGMISLGEFMPHFEDSGFIRQIDYLIFDSVLQFLQRRLDAGKPVVPISLNLSKAHFNTADYFAGFKKQFMPIFERYHVPHKYIEFEIPESLMMDNQGILFRMIEELKNCGFSCSLDDFGSGFSSLNSIKSLPIPTLKLDQKMFTEEAKERGKVVVEGILQIASGLDMKVVAEGVETREYVDFLKKHGCHYVQGYYFSRPLPEEEFEALLPDTPSL